MAKRLHLSSRHRSVLKGLLQQHLPDVEAWAYGSRVNGRSHEGSDLDLALRARDLTKIPAKQLADFKDAVCESAIPFLVEVRDWARLSEDFQRKIERAGVVLTGQLSKPGTLHGAAESDSTAAQPDRTTNALEEMCDLIVDCPHFTPDWTDSGHVVIRNQNIRNGRLNLSNPSFTHDEDFRRRIERARPRAGDIIFTREAPMGEVCMVPSGLECCLGQRQVLIRPSKDSSGNYLLYALQSPAVRRQVFWNEGTGSTVSNVRIPVLRDLRIPRLGSGEAAVADFLTALDDKIELNRRMNETLEAMARALFKSWFVDFEPVRAKIEGRDTRLCQPIADLFPIQLVETELGPLPQGWEISTTGKEIDSFGGGTPSTKEPAFWEQGAHAWATPKDLSNLSSLSLQGTSRQITDAGLKKISSGLLPVGTVLLSSRAPIGYLAIAEIPTAVNQGFIAMVCQKRLSNLFVLFWCASNLNNIRRIAGGSTFAEINKKAFRSMPMVVPPAPILDAFESVVRPQYDRIAFMTKEIAALIQTRDALLPKLISGEIRVPQAEEAVLAAMGDTDA